MPLTRRDVLAGAAAVAAVSALPASAALKYVSPPSLIAGEQIYQGDVIRLVAGKIMRCRSLDDLFDHSWVSITNSAPGDVVAVCDPDDEPVWLVQAPDDPNASTF